MRRCSGLAVVTLVAAATCPARAHHSIAGIYDSSRQITVAGVVTEFRFVRPHAFLIISVATDAAESELWQLEMDNHFELAQIGITAATFQPGDAVIVGGNPSRSGDSRLYLRRLDRPADGLVYEQVGYRPRVDVPQRPLAHD